ncbi:uncharacterized protein LOC135370734 [Ornithodoros turicata]|uniref:uncharacterized protein LOC135370734 n=1 Tax=Ornithodoros turicata TaxID=34597 RepID=UPI003139AAA6
MPSYEFQHHVLKNFNILRLAIQQQGELLSSLMPLQNSLTEAPKLLENPLSSVEELETFEGQLTPDREKQLILELPLLGGNSTKVAVRRIMSYVLSNELGRQYSWEGRKGKLPLRDLNLPKLILRTIHSHKKFVKTTRYEVEHQIKEWLRHARDRAERASVPRRVQAQSTA